MGLEAEEAHLPALCREATRVTARYTRQANTPLRTTTWSGYRLLDLALRAVCTVAGAYRLVDDPVMATPLSGI